MPHAHHVWRVAPPTTPHHHSTRSAHVTVAGREKRDVNLRMRLRRRGKGCVGQGIMWEQGGAAMHARSSQRASRAAANRGAATAAAAPSCRGCARGKAHHHHGDIVHNTALLLCHPAPPRGVHQLEQGGGEGWRVGVWVGEKGLPGRVAGWWRQRGGGQSQQLGRSSPHSTPPTHLPPPAHAPRGSPAPRSGSPPQCPLPPGGR